MNDDFENDLNNLIHYANELKRKIKGDNICQDLIDECRRTVELAGKLVERMAKQLKERNVSETDSVYPKVVDFCLSFLNSNDEFEELNRRCKTQDDNINQLTQENEEKKKKIIQLEGKIKEKTEKVAQLERVVCDKTKYICELTNRRLSPANVVSDQASSYTLDGDFMLFLQKKLSRWENGFPREETTQDEIDVFKKYLKSSLLRDSEQEVADIREKINNSRFDAFIKDFDEITKVVYDPQQGGRLFHKYDIYLPDLNDEARQKLLSEDETFSERVAIGGRSVRYYDDSKKFVMCNGETKYKSTDEVDVLFPGLCARCINGADILLLIPPYLYKRPAKSSTEVSAQSELKQETVVVPTSESDVGDKELKSVQNAPKQAVEADTSSEPNGSTGEFAQDDLNDKINVDKKSKSDVLNNEPKSAQNVPKQTVEADTSSEPNVSPKKIVQSEPKREIEPDKTSESDALNKKSESAQNAQKREVEADTSSEPNVSPKKIVQSEPKREIEPDKTSESNASQKRTIIVKETVRKTTAKRTS